MSRTFAIGDIHGAGSNGKLTVMDVDTLEYWQSDLVETFYGTFKPG